VRRANRAVSQNREAGQRRNQERDQIDPSDGRLRRDLLVLVLRTKKERRFVRLQSTAPS
jgi:hypothetical protein